jgi:hypothetical protein
VSGESIKHAEDIWKSDRGKERSAPCMGEILNGPDEILVDLLSRNMCKIIWVSCKYRRCKEIHFGYFKREGANSSAPKG